MSILLAATLFIACNDSGERRADASLESVYFDYRISGEESKSNVTILLQYKEAGEEGATFVIEKPGSVQLDGEIIDPDSAKITGAFYETQRPLANFSGRHSITFTDVNGKKHIQEFEFLPFSFTIPLPQRIKRSDLKFQLQGLKPKDSVRVIMTDTSFASKDINEFIRVFNGELNIPEGLLPNITHGPIIMEFFKENEQIIKKGQKETGRISVTYGLRREFILEN